MAKVKITEGTLRNMVKESVKKVLNFLSFFVLAFKKEYGKYKSYDYILLNLFNNK